MLVVWLNKHSNVNRDRHVPSEVQTLGATDENTMRPDDRPRLVAYCRTLVSPTAGNLSSHSTLFGTAFRMFTHISSVRGSILYSWLKLQ